MLGNGADLGAAKFHKAKDIEYHHFLCPKQCIQSWIFPLMHKTKSKLLNSGRKKAINLRKYKEGFNERTSRNQ